MTGPAAHAVSALLAEERTKAKEDLAAADVAFEAADEQLRQKRNNVRTLLNRPLLRKKQDRSGRKDIRDRSDRDRSDRVFIADFDKDPSLKASTARGNRDGNNTATWHAPDLLSPEETARLANPASGVAPFPSPTRRAEIAARANFLFNKDVLRICAVCDHQEFDTDPLTWHGLRHQTAGV